MSRPRFSLRRQLAVLVTALVAAISLFIFLTVPRWLERAMLDGEISRAHSVAGMTAYSVSPALVFGDVAGFDEGFAGARENRDLAYLIVTDSLGHVIRRHNVSAADSAVPAVALDGALVSGNVVTVRAPIVSGGRTIGYLYLGMSLGSVDAQVQQARAAVAVMSLLVFGIGMIAVFLISTYVTRPLGAIVATVERIVEGDRSRRAPIAGSDEVAHLATAFNRMVDNVDAARQQLEEANGSLEARVAARTTELEAMQNQLVQAQKMEAVGQLAGGVAHDFNNLLTAIIIEIELSIDSLPEHDPIRAELGQALEAANQGQALTRQLLAFGRKQMLIPRIVDLGRLVSDTHGMLRRLIGEDVELRIAGGQSLWAVRADPGQLQQVIMNLSVNARDAMPQGGVISIETANATVDESLAGANGPAAGRYVMLKVRDTGIGMDENVRAHLFEPFFTTKGVGKGTGLGLATVYGIVKQSGGSIYLDSTLGAGAVFRIYLPAIEGAEREVEAAPTLTTVGGTETVLLVEDDDRVRAAASRVLTSRGYTVLAAINGSEAIKVVTRYGKPDLLLTDVVMPGINGLQLARELRVRYPELRVLCASGYAPDVADPRGGLPAGVPLLLKPYTPDVLARAVRRVLDGHSEL